MTAQPAVAAAAQARTLVDVLEWHVARNPDRRHVTVLQDERTVLATMTYAELSQGARKVAAGLMARDVVAGDRVALMLPTGTDFFTAFFGILYTGAVPVPIYPPMQLSQLEDYLRRQAEILRNAEADSGDRAGGLAARGPAARPRPVAECDRERRRSDTAPAQAALPSISDPAATALIQYTSGSTGDPKGSCSAMPTCWPTFAPSSRRSMRPPLTCC